MKFLSTQRLYTLNDLKKFINTEDYSIIGEMHHFLKDQLEKLKHNTSYKYLDKALRPKIVDLKMLLTELTSNYETTIFKSSREYSIPDVPTTIIMTELLISIMMKIIFYKRIFKLTT